MEFEAFTSLMENKGGGLKEFTVYRVPVDREEYKYEYLMKQIPKDASGTLHGDYLWLCWHNGKVKEDFQKLIEDEVAFIGDAKETTINLLSDDYWSPVGYDLIKNSVINKAYASGPYFKNDHGDICLGKSVEENKGRKVFVGLKIRLYRNSERSNFYASFDVVSELEVESDAPDQWKDNKNFVDLTPKPDKRIKRLKQVLDPMKSNNEIRIQMNDSELCFNSNKIFNREVKRG